MSSIYDIQGTNCRFQLLIGDDYLDFICAKNFRIGVVTDMKETTTVGSGFWKEHRPKKLSYTLTLSGVVQVVEEQNRPVIAGLLESQRQFLPVGFRLLYIDNSSNPLVLRGSTYVTSSELSADPINLLDGTIQFIGTGGLLIEYEIPVYIDMTVEVTGIADAKCKFTLINTDGEQVYNTDSLDETQANGGWLIQGQSVTFNVLSGNYYWGMQASDVNSDDNDFDLDTPAPGPAHIDFDHNPVSGGSYPIATHDFTANRTATFTIGEELPPPACIDVSIVGTPALPDAEEGIPYFYSFDLDGTAPFSVTLNDRPAWMNVIINGSTVEFSGTPNVAGTAIPVDITITNCSSGSANFSNTIDVAAASEEQSIVNWQYNEVGTNGSLGIRINGVLIVTAISPDSGSFNAIPGDQIIAFVGAGLVNLRTLVVSGTVEGTLYNESDNVNQEYEFTVSNGSNYTISGTVSAP